MPARLIRLLFGEPSDLMFLLALLPAIAAGLFFFSAPALISLGIAVLVGLVVTAGVGLRASAEVGPLAGVRPLVAPLLATVATAMLLPASLPPLFLLAAFVVAALLAVTGRGFSGWIRVHPALVGFLVGLALLRGHFGLLPLPFDSADTVPDPLLQGGSVLDPIRLYVGDVPGLLGATSMLAAAIGVLFVYQAPRLRRENRASSTLWPLLGFVLAEAVAARLAGMDLVGQLLQASTLVALGLLAADTRLVEDRPVVGLAAGAAGGAVAVLLRLHSAPFPGLGLEAVPIGAVVTMLLATPLQRLLLPLRERRSRPPVTVRPRPAPVTLPDSLLAPAPPAITTPENVPAKPVRTRRAKAGASAPLTGKSAPEPGVTTQEKAEAPEGAPGKVADAEADVAAAGTGEPPSGEPSEPG